MPLTMGCFVVVARYSNMSEGRFKFSSHQVEVVGGRLYFQLLLSIASCFGYRHVSVHKSTFDKMIWYQGGEQLRKRSLNVIM